MGTYSIVSKYNTQDKCIAYLEELRWSGSPVCTHCGNDENITKRQDSNIYHCNQCNKDFTVLMGTIFEHSRLPLPKWFFIITLMLEAKNGISSTQLSENAEVSYKTAWLTSMRIRCAMIEDIELSGVVEADETYVGGKPRKRYKSDNSFTQLSQVTEDADKLKITNSKRGRGTSKAKIAGMVERKGRVVLRLMDTFNTTTLLAMLKRNVNTSSSIVITDEARFYNKFEDFVEHFVIKHKEAYVQGNIHTNTIEGFWSIVKGGIKGQYRVLSKRYLPFYLAEFAYRYNRRNNKELIFEEFLSDAVSEGKCMMYYKPLVDPRKITNALTPEQKELSAKNVANKNKKVTTKKNKNDAHNRLLTKARKIIKKYNSKRVIK